MKCTEFATLRILIQLPAPHQTSFCASEGTHAVKYYSSPFYTLYHEIWYKEWGRTEISIADKGNAMCNTALCVWEREILQQKPEESLHQLAKLIAVNIMHTVLGLKYSVWVGMQICLHMLKRNRVFSQGTWNWGGGGESPSSQQSHYYSWFYVALWICNQSFYPATEKTAEWGFPVMGREFLIMCMHFYSPGPDNP